MEITQVIVVATTQKCEHVGEFDSYVKPPPKCEMGKTSQSIKLTKLHPNHPKITSACPIVVVWRAFSGEVYEFAKNGMMEAILIT